MTISYNDPSTWATPELYRAPSFDAQAFQRKLDKIAGKRRGRPVVRLVWAGAKECFSTYYDDWDEFGKGIRTELRAKYLFASIRIPETTDRIDIPPPRWILEERHEPEQYAASWEQARFVLWSKGDGSGEQRKVERRPPPPKEYYSHLWTISEHDEFCCELTRGNGIKTCWGKYRTPDDRDLEIIKRAVFRRNHDVEQSPFEQLSEASQADAKQKAQVVIDRQREEADKAHREYIEEHGLELVQHFTGVDMTDKMKKFSLPSGHRQTESGLIVPN